MIKKSFFDEPVKNDFRTYDNTRNIATNQGDDYTTGCLVTYPYFKKYYKLIAIDLRKLHADPKARQQINLTVNLNRKEGATMFFITNRFRFSKRNRESVIILFCFNVISI